MNKTTDIVERARALVSAATPGPWHKSAHDDRDHPTLDIWTEADLKRTEGHNRLIAFNILNADAALIAAAPELLTALADEVARLHKLLQECVHRPVFQEVLDAGNEACAERNVALAEVERLREERDEAVEAAERHRQEKYKAWNDCAQFVEKRTALTRERDDALVETERFRAQNEHLTTTQKAVCARLQAALIAQGVAAYDYERLEVLVEHVIQHLTDLTQERDFARAVLRHVRREYMTADHNDPIRDEIDIALRGRGASRRGGGEP